MMNAMMVEMVISTLNSILSEENKPIGRSVSNGLTERPGLNQWYAYHQILAHHTILPAVRTRSLRHARFEWSSNPACDVAP